MACLKHQSQDNLETKSSRQYLDDADVSFSTN